MSKNWANVEAATGFEKLPAGGYICGITSAERFDTKEYDKFEFDIAEGEHKNYYRNLYDSKGFWAASFIKSFKPKAEGFYRAMLDCFEASNSDFTVAKYGDDPKELRRLLVGLVLGYEEYEGNDGKIKTRLIVTDIKSTEDIRKGNFDVKSLKKLEGTRTSSKSSSFAEIDGDGDLPF